MLAKAQRVTSGDEFGRVIRTGRKAGSRTVVVHCLPDSSASQREQSPARWGFVVSKAVGNAVIRNRVKRRLRHLARDVTPSLPGSVALVVRALPPAGTASTAELAGDLGRCLDRCARGAGVSGTAR